VEADVTDGGGDLDEQAEPADGGTTEQQRDEGAGADLFKGVALSTLVLVTIAAARWHAARGHAQQAAASRQTAEHLRAAYRQAAAAPLQTLRGQGRSLPEPKRRSYENTIRAAFPAHGVPGEYAADTDALTATLAQAEQAGHDPKTLLRKAIDMRELDTAEDVNDVLIWRLCRLANLPAHPGSSARSMQAVYRKVAPAAPRPALPDPLSRSPRR
jgi:hypothetical protein